MAPSFLVSSVAAVLICAAGAQAPVRVQAPAMAVLSDLASGMDLDEDYRAQFAACDAANEFHGESLPGGRGCRGDPNKVDLLRRLSDDAIAYVSKLSVDLDGSPFACSPDHGPSDQCQTSLMLRADDGERVPLDADRVPYVVIPSAGPDDAYRGEFSRLTGVRVGDFGIVIKDGTVVPVIVGDTGPYYKLGEGSMALHRALGRELCTQRDDDGVCRAVVPRMTSIDDGVITVLFPGSRRTDLTPQNIEAIVGAEGMRLWNARRSAATAALER